MKSDIMKQIAEQTGLQLIDVKLSDSNHSDFLGQPMEGRGGTDYVPASVCFPTPSREINVGDGVLMEYAEGVIELVLVQAIEDGVVYGEGDDGEPYCAPLANCDKVPF